MSVGGFFYNGKSKRREIWFLIVGMLLFLLLLEEVVSDGANGSEQPESAQPSNQREYVRSGRKKMHAVSLAHLPMPHAERFPFDPNSADSTILRRLGFQDWQIRNIYKYRAKGGIYRQPEDVARIYGVTKKQYLELLPYIHISADYRPAAELVGDRVRKDSSVRDSFRYPIKLQYGETVDLNSSDTSVLKRLPGVGSYYARRIAGYRQRLGGFYSASQLDEIEGLPDSVRRYVTVDVGSVRRLNLNRLSLKQLQSHPYINFYQARAIVEARRLVGTLSSTEDLLMLKEFTEKDIRRLQPYIEF